MKLSGIFTTLGMCATIVLGTPNASADQTYHTERLDLQLTQAGAGAGHPALRSGQVVNIHPNGAINGAIERYMINGAKPNTRYHVEILVFDGADKQCLGDSIFFVPTATMTTNAQGSAHGQGHFSRANLVPFKGAVLPVNWSLRDDNSVSAYETRCTVVSVD